MKPTVTSSTAPPEELFAGRYRVGVRLRGNALSDTYRAHDQQLARDVTVTVLREDLAQVPAANGLFTARIAAAADLDHPHIARIFDAGVDDWKGLPIPWMAGEPLDAPNLDELPPRSDTEGASWVITVLAIAEQLADALQYAHATGTIHGNLSPATVLLTTGQDSTPDVRVTDFGPQPADLAEPSDPELTRLMWARFTACLEYPSPEQLDGHAPNRRSDIFGFGCIIAALLLNTPTTQSDETTAPAGVDIDLAAELRRIAKKAMKKRPADRQHSFLVVQDELRLIRVAHALDTRTVHEPAAATQLQQPTAILGAAIDAPTEEIRVTRRQHPTSPGRRPHSGRLRTRRPMSSPARLAILLAALILCVGAFWALGTRAGTSQAGTVTIPAVADQTVAAASSTLSAAGISIAGQQTIPSSTVPAGSVAGTNPPAGAHLGVGQSVTLDVSTGPTLVSIPQLDGLTLVAARTALSGAGLTAGAITQRDGSATAGIVLSASPDYGQHVATGSPIALTVASGDQRIPTDLVGQAQQAVVDALSTAGFSPQVISQDTGSFSDGVVLDVSPTAGSRAPLGSIVTITAAQFVPNLSPSPTPTPASSPPATGRASPPPTQPPRSYDP